MLFGPYKHILILRRAKHSKRNAGYWELPGGKIEPDMDTENNLAREVYEETGITKSQLRFLQKLLNTNRTLSENSSHYHQIACEIYTAKTPTNNVSLSSENDDYLWIDIDDPRLKELQLTYETMQAINYLQSQPLLRTVGSIRTPRTMGAPKNQ